MKSDGKRQGRIILLQAQPAEFVLNLQSGEWPLSPAEERTPVIPRFGSFPAAGGVAR